MLLRYLYQILDIVETQIQAIFDQFNRGLDTGTEIQQGQPENL